jgi:hypothetical protein
MSTRFFAIKKNGGEGGIRNRGTEKIATKMIKPNPLIAKRNPYQKSFCHEQWKI